jgi:hypothetical protein
MDKRPEIFLRSEQETQLKFSKSARKLRSNTHSPIFPFKFFKYALLFQSIFIQITANIISMSGKISNKICRSRQLQIMKQFSKISFLIVF